MRSYAPVVDLGSVTDDYFSSLYNKIYSLLSSLKERVASYLSKVWYHLNIVGSLDEREEKLQELSDLGGQVAGIKKKLNTTSQIVGRYTGSLGTVLGEIRDSLHNGEDLTPYGERLEKILEQLPK